MLKKISFKKITPSQKELIFSLISSFICLVFALYNGILGVINSSIWYGSVSAYYILLLFIKLFLLISSKICLKKRELEKTIAIISFIILFIITGAMVTPIIELLKNNREYNLGLIPAIASAAYTTYSFVTSIIKLKRSNKNSNIFSKQTKLINLIQTLMSILVLQNTLILVNGGYNDSMNILSFWSSILILLSILFLIIFYFVRYLINLKNISSK